MTFRDLVRPDSQVFLKSEWGPASDYWPALSYSKQAVGRKIRSAYTPSRDFLIYTGTSNPAHTKDPAFRSRLLSFVSIDLSREFKTWELIPKESWEQAQVEFRGRWPYAFAIRAAWEIVTLPPASLLVPEAYRQLGNPANFGSIVPVLEPERSSVLDLEVQAVTLQKQPAAIQADARRRYLDADRWLKQEVYRMAQLIVQRASSSGAATTLLRPVREANPPMETQEMIFRKWEEQQGHCGLCQRCIAMPPAKGLLQPSVDRIDSTNVSYQDGNIHITHLGCNLAKNKFTRDEFEEWLEVITPGERVLS